MNKLTGIIVLSLFLSIPLSSQAVEVGDPDSDSAPVITEPEANPLTTTDDDNPDAQVDKTNNPTGIKAPPPVPGEHLVPQLTEAPPEDDTWHEMKVARLQGLNKVTAKTSEIKADIGAKIKFGNLEFTVEKCLRGPENEKIENTALFTIWDEIPGQEKKQVFHGWMFSSSPAISALEHPIYDIILIGCGEAPKVDIPAPADDKKAVAKKAGKKVKAPIQKQ